MTDPRIESEAESPEDRDARIERETRNSVHFTTGQRKVLSRLQRSSGAA